MPSTHEESSSPRALAARQFAEAERLLAAEGICLGPPRADWLDDSPGGEADVSRDGQSAGSQDSAAGFFEHLLGAYQRRFADLQSSGTALSEPPVGIARMASSPVGTLHAAGGTEPPDALARAMSTLLGSTLCEYVGTVASDPAADQTLSLQSSVLPAAACGSAADASALRQSMRLALCETLESGRGLDRTPSRTLSWCRDWGLASGGDSVSLARGAQTSGAGFGDVRVGIAAWHALEDSGSSPSGQLVGEAPGSAGAAQAFGETQSVIGESQLLPGQSVVGASFSEAESPGEAFGAGLVDMLHLLGETLTPEGGQDGGLINLLRELGSADLDGTVRQARQLGNVLAGRGLTAEEIQALPKARFDRAEEQSCAICLVDYRRGELLTRLECSHFFHVACITEWMRQATQCPLCRADYAA